MDSELLERFTDNTLSIEELDLSSFIQLTNFSNNHLNTLKHLKFNKNNSVGCFMNNNNFQSLQNMDISGSNILSIDGTYASGLLNLNASDNYLTGSIKNFTSPKLQSLNYSHNTLFEFKDWNY